MATQEELQKELDAITQQEKEILNQNAFEHASAPGLLSSATVEKEMPPAMSTSQRFKLVGLGKGSPQEKFSYLKEQFPQYEVFHDPENGGFALGDKETGKVYPVDPSPGNVADWVNSLGTEKGLKEAGQDVVDIVPEAGKTAAAIGAGLATGGMMPAAAGTSWLATTLVPSLAMGATGYGADVAQQKIAPALRGQNMDIPVNQKEALTEGALQAGGNLLLPMSAPLTGKALKETIEKFGLSKAEQMAAAREGLLKKGFLGTYGFLSGTAPEQLRRGMRYINEVKGLEKSGAAEAMTNRIGNEITSSFERQIGDIGDRISALQKMVSESGGKVDISAAREAVYNRINELENAYRQFPNKANEEDIKALRNLADRFFSQEVKGEAARPPSMIVQDVGNGRVEPAIPGTPATSSEMVPLPNEVDPEAAMKLMQDLKEPANMASNQETFGLAPSKESVLKAREQGTFSAAEQKIADEYYKKINEQQAALMAKNEDVAAQFPDAAIVDPNTGVVVKRPGEGPLRQEYADWKTFQRQIGKQFDTPENIWKNLQGMDKNSKRILMDKIARMDQELGTNLARDIEVLDAYKTFGRAPGDPRFFSKAGIPGAAATSQAFGLGLGVPFGVPGWLLGSAIGYPIGTTMFGPAARRGLVELGAKGSQMGLSNATKAAPGLWELLNNKIQGAQ